MLRKEMQLGLLVRRGAVSWGGDEGGCGAGHCGVQTDCRDERGTGADDAAVSFCADA